MIKKLLCATDGTDHSRTGLIVAAELAQKYGANLTICVINVAHGGARGVLISHWTDDEVKKIIDAAVVIAEANGVKSPNTVVLASREAPAGIVSYAEQNEYDHIVVGTGDKRGISRLVLGSVAAEVAARAHCSVTVAR
ncbi:MAG: universal stress protein [Defluviimonas sp.]|uniref:universal stress protein n=1 Tax=Albidovulum sp. TaxID=1872424 RepID=UPI002A2F80BB|nr:universal stress protein [Defluviimonas sp.]